jgi:hypothetical protein|tara:strand:- start:6937 stop:7341 length:405 start_codon:yes stop_codon:yes gene_type:complete
MAYTPPTSSGAKTPFSNLAVKKAQGTQSIIEFLSGLEADRTELDGAQYDAAVGFFLSRDYERQSAESIAYVLMKQAKIDGANVFTVLDTLNKSGAPDLSQLVAEILNAYRYKTSIIGFKNDRDAQDHVFRNIIA